MGKKSGNSVQPVDPVATANAQAQANLQTAQQQQRLNMINTTGPSGSVTYQADPNAPGGYRQVTSLSPAEQAIFDKQKQVELGATNIAGDQLGRVNQALQTPLDTNGLPALQGGVNAGPVQTAFNQGQGLQYSFDPGQAVQGHVGPADLNAASQQAQNAVYQQAASRLDPRFAQDEERLRTQLANQGLSQNSDAYKNAMDTFSRSKNDAYNQAIYSSVGAGNDTANQLFGQSLAQGQFANQAAAQMYGQNQGLAAFRNATANQDYTQNLGAAQFANQAQNQQFNQGLANAQLANTARQQGLQERAYIQNEPINQLTGLLGLGQVGSPQGVQYTPTQVQGTDVLGAYALNQQGQQANANRAAQAQSGLMNGLFSLGSAAIMSDRRLKRDVRLLRRRPDGIGVYEYRYKWGGPLRTGVMAQEVRRVRPELVERRPGGYLVVDYAGLDLEAA